MKATRNIAMHDTDLATYGMRTHMYGLWLASIAISPPFPQKDNIFLKQARTMRWHGPEQRSGG